MKTSTGRQCRDPRQGTASAIIRERRTFSLAASETDTVCALIDPNDNLRRLILAIHALIQNKRAVAGLQAVVALNTLLTLFLFGQDYFGWWRSPLPPSADAALVGLMYTLSLALCGFLALLGSLFFTLRGRSPARAVQPLSRAFRAALMPALYGLPALWGRAYLTGSDPSLWGRLAVTYAFVYQGCILLLLTSERVEELRKRRSGMSAQGAQRAGGAALDGPARQRRAERLSFRSFLWRRWWHLTHPSHLRRLSPLDRSLYAAAVRGDTQNAAAYLTRGANPNLRLACDMPLLNLVVTGGHAEVVRLMLEKGVDIEAASPNTGFNPLLVAAKDGDLVVARLLLEYGASVDARVRSGTAALGLAARQGNAEMVRLLLSRGAPVNAFSKSGTTALMLAASCGHAEAIRALLDAGADAAVRNAKGVTALEYARRKGHGAAVKLLASGDDS